MNKTSINNVINLFGHRFGKTNREADVWQEQREKLVHKKIQLNSKIANGSQGIERKLLKKKVMLLDNQIKKIKNNPDYLPENLDNPLLTALTGKFQL